MALDILDMFRALDHSLHALPDEIRDPLGVDTQSRLRFGGFDGNHRLEGPMLGYVRFLVRTDRWVELQKRLGEIDDELAYAASSRLRNHACGVPVGPRAARNGAWDRTRFLGSAGGRSAEDRPSTAAPRRFSGMRSP